MRKPVVYCALLLLTIGAVLVFWPGLWGDEALPAVPGAAEHSGDDGGEIGHGAGGARGDVTGEGGATRPSRAVVAKSRAATSRKNPAPKTAIAGMGLVVVEVRSKGSGKPISDVAVALRPGTVGDGWIRPEVRKTDADGTARFDPMLPGRFWVAAAGGRAYGLLRAGQETVVRVRVPDGYSLEGLVRAANNQAVAGASIWLSDGSLPWQGYEVARSDERGRFRLSHLSGRRYLSVWHKAYSPSRMYQVEGKAGAKISLEVMVGGRSGVVRGIVVDPQQQPVAGAEVQIGTENPEFNSRSEDGSWVPGPPARQTRTDAEGRFVIVGMAPGDALLRVHTQAYPLAQQELVVVAGGEVDVRVQLQRGATLFGVARDADGDSLSRVRVSVEGQVRFGRRWAFTDAKGRYRMPGVPVGKPIQVKAQRWRAGVATLSTTLQPGAEQRWDPILVPKDAAESASKKPNGRLLDHNGRGLAGWWVVVAGARNKRQSVRTDARGFFRVDVKPEQTCRVEAVPRGRYSGFPYLVVTRVRFDLELLELRVPEPESNMARLRAEIVDERGEPLAVKAHLFHREQTLWRAFASDAQGRFDVFPVPPGKIAIKLRAKGRPWKELGEHVFLGGQALDLGRIELGKSGAVLTGRLRRRDGVALVAPKVRVLDAQGKEACVVHVHGQSFRSGPVPLGREYRVYVQGENFAPIVTPVRPSQAGDHRLDLTADPGVTQQLRLVLAAGQKKPGYVTLNVLRAVDKGYEPYWFGGAEGHALGQIQLTLAAGRYMVHAFADRKWVASGAMEIGGQAVAKPVEIAFRRR